MTYLQEEVHLTLTLDNYQILNYPSLSNDRTSAYDYEIVKNLFKRAVVREDIFGDIVSFTKYSVEG